MPTQFTLLVDGSQSMSRRIDLVRATARRMTSRLRHGDMVTVAPFRRGDWHDDRADQRRGDDCRGHRRHSRPRAARRSSIRSPRCRSVFQGGGPSGDHPGHRRLRRTQQYQLASRPGGSQETAGDHLRDWHRRRRRRVDERARPCCGRSPVQTGGRAFFPSREEQLPDVYDTIVSDVHSRYLLTYTPSHQEPDGRFRKIRVDRDRSRSTRSERATAISRPSRRRSGRRSSSAPATEGSGSLSLEAQDLEMIEDDVPQTVDAFQEANAPISIALALDGSGSIRPAARVGEGCGAHLRRVAPAVRSAGAGAVFRRRRDVHTWLSKNRQTSIDAINAHRATGGTALWDALARFDRAARPRAGAQGGGRGDGWPRRKQPGHSAGQPSHAG